MIEKMSNTSGFEKMNGEQLLRHYYMRGLKDLLVPIQEQMQMGGQGAELLDSKEFKNAVQNIQKFINEKTKANVGNKVTPEAIRDYVQGIIDRGL